MNITSLQTFLAIVETGSLVRASHKMNVTQSTVTARLKALEEDIGQVLLNRQKSGTTLTPAGTKFLRYAKIMTGIWRQAKFETGMPAGFDAVCAFGCDTELWHSSGQQFFDSVTSNHKNIALSVQQGSSSELEEWLSAGVIDVVITFEAVARGNQTVHELSPEELVLYADRPGAPMKFDPNYIFVDHGADFRQQHAQAYHDAYIARISFDSAIWALEHLLRSSGTAYLPRALAASYVDAGQLFEVQDAPVFFRKKCMVVNDSIADNWSWFPTVVAEVSGKQSQRDTLGNNSR